MWGYFILYYTLCVVFMYVALSAIGGNYKALGKYLVLY